MRKGSLTVFVSLIMVAVMTLIFAMAECIRYVAIDTMADEFTAMAVESSYSEYNPYLWTNYRILAIDLGYGTENIGPGIFETKTADYCECNSNVEDGNNYGRLKVASCEASQYALLTDGEGQAVVDLGVKAAKQGLGAQVIDFMQSQINEINSVEQLDANEQINNAKKNLDDAKADKEEKKKKAKEKGEKVDDSELEEMEDNPFQAFSMLQDLNAKGLLSQVISVNNLSDVSVDKETLPSHRELNKGTMENVTDTNLVDKVLFVDYLMTNYSYYNGTLKHDGFQYELEYLISGEESDVQNLSAVVAQMLLIREGANVITIYSSSLKDEAAVVAEILAGWTMNPAIVELVKVAVIGIWAYAESVLDVRQIMSGGKVPLFKNKDDWSADLYHLSTIADVNVKGKNSDTGIGYKEYLMAFLALKSNSTLGMRALDVMENALHTTEDYKNVKVDNMMYESDVSIGYTSNEMFLSLLDSSRKSGEYYIEKNKFMTY